MRPDLAIVADLVPPRSRILDLGCGDGTLLGDLIERGSCAGTGVEIDPDGVVSAIRRGVSVIELDIDTQLDEFADDSYDVVVLSQTLQATHRPAVVLAEMGRIGDTCIVSVPNFGLWRHRMSLLLRGRMPRSRELPQPWHETPNIHLSTLLDLEALFATIGLSVRRRVLLAADHRPLRASVAANLRAVGAIYALGTDVRHNDQTR